MSVNAMQTQMSGWRAELAFDFDSTPIGTRLASRRHTGPLVVQRPLYPEGGSLLTALQLIDRLMATFGEETDLAKAGRAASSTTGGRA